MPWRRRSEGCGQHIGQPATGAAVPVKAWIVDGDLDTDGLAACHGNPQRRPQFVPRQPARDTKIDCWHDRVVKTVGVQMDEEAFELRTPQMVDGIARRGLDSHLAHGGKIKCPKFLGKRLASELFLILVIAIGERDDVVRSHQRAAALNVGQERRPMSGRERKIH